MIAYRLRLNDLVSFNVQNGMNVTTVFGATDCKETGVILAVVSNDDVQLENVVYKVVWNSLTPIDVVHSSICEKISE